jgi:hypothetical protein
MPPFLGLARMRSFRSLHPLFCIDTDSLTCNGYGHGMSLLREPDAANPHVRFDESAAWERAVQAIASLRSRSG